MSSVGQTGTERHEAGEHRAVLGRRIRWTVRATIAWNAAEAVVGVTAGTAARSGALAGFGLDSVIEVCSALALAWQYAGPDPARRERRTLRLVACSFLCLAVVLVVGSVQALLAHRAAATSGAGVTLAALSVVVMPSIAAVQRHAGRELGSATAVADSRQGLLCAAMAAALLVGSGAGGTRLVVGRPRCGAADRPPGAARGRRSVAGRLVLCPTAYGAPGSGRHPAAARGHRLLHHLRRLRLAGRLAGAGADQ